MKLRYLRYVPRRWAASYLMHIARREISGACTSTSMTITDENVGLMVWAWTGEKP